MPTYVFQNKAGKQIERQFEIGKAPDHIGDYERIVAYPRATIFNGPGWATVKKEPHKVSWDQVEKITKESDRRAAENEKKRHEALKDSIREVL